MGGNLCTLQSSSRKPLKDQYESDDQHFNQGTPITSVMQRGCCFKIMTKRKQLQLEAPVKKLAKMKKLTLEEWLTTSPGNVKPDSINSSGELHAFRQSSRKVHPSIGRVNDEQLNTTKQKESLDLVMNDVEEASKADLMTSTSSLIRSQSGKSKKKVSFRLPEEADIILFYSPEEHFEEFVAQNFQEYAEAILVAYKAYIWTVLSSDVLEEEDAGCKALMSSSAKFKMQVGSIVGNLLIPRIYLEWIKGL